MMDLEKTRFDCELHLHRSLAEAKLAAMREVSYVKKQEGGKLGYPYVSEEDILQVVRPAMIRHGITLNPTKVQQLEAGQFKTKNGAIMRVVRLQVTFGLQCALEDGKTETAVVETVGEGADSMDKASGKAMTAALKYALRQTFLVASGLDPDKYKSQDIVASMEGADRATEASYNKFFGALSTIRDAAQLDRLHEKYHQRSFTSEMLSNLDDLYAKAREEISLAEEAKNGPASTGGNLSGDGSSGV